MLKVQSGTGTIWIRTGIVVKLVFHLEHDEHGQLKAFFLRVAAHRRVY